MGQPVEEEDKEEDTAVEVDREALLRLCYDALASDNDQGVSAANSLSFLRLRLRPPPGVSPDGRRVLAWMEEEANKEEEERHGNNQIKRERRMLGAEEFVQSLLLLVATMDDASFDSATQSFLQLQSSTTTTTTTNNNNNNSANTRTAGTRNSKATRDMIEDQTTKRQREWYTPDEVSLHCTSSNCWLSFLGIVVDLTQLIQSHPEGVLARPIVENAGRDVSQWFDEETGDVKRRVDKERNVEGYYTPMGRFIHVPPEDVRSDWDSGFDAPWWRDPKYRVGKLSRRRRPVRVKNVLTGQEDLIDVPAEETVEEIRERFMAHNAHGGSYTWKVMLRDPNTGAWNFEPLDLRLTLDENGVPDERGDYQQLALNDDFYIPVIHLYYNDDLTVA
eukprot:jgi/Chlat1/658/Chrsp103S01060